MTSLPNYFTVDRLAVEIHRDRQAAGGAAARAAAAGLRDILAMQERARVIFGCAPSQDDFLAALVDPRLSGVTLDWRRITVFHMDEYVGLAGDAPSSFRTYLRQHLLNHVEAGEVHLIAGEQRDTATVCREYARRLGERPIDLICLGIGENGHIAFNDPPVADFEDAALVKVVELDQACRQQQVNDGCFPTLTAVPSHAITLTVPVFRQARRLVIQVPGERKAAAVRATLRGPISPACPASILRLHPHATLYLDPASAGPLPPG